MTPDTRVPTVGQRSALEQQIEAINEQIADLKRQLEAYSTPRPVRRTRTDPRVLSDILADYMQVLAGGGTE